MRKLFQFITVLMLPFLSVVVSSAESRGYDNTSVVISDAYVRALPPTVKNTAAYFTIHNEGSDTISLLGAHTDAAKTVQLHETVEEDGMMHMLHRMSAEVPAGGKVILESGGLHLMVMGLLLPLAPGDSISLTLEFSQNQEITIEVPVQSVMAETIIHNNH